MDEVEIFTIGHSNHSLEDFLRLLKRHRIQVLVDVRSEPYSRYSPQFNKAVFQHDVQAAGFQYRFSGDKIGGKPADPSLHTASGAPDYDKLAASEAFQTEVDAVIELARTARIVLMCSEADPNACHRERIIAQVLRSKQVKVTHILPDGSTARQDQQALF